MKIMRRGMILLFIFLLSTTLFLPQILADEQESALGGYSCLESIVNQTGCDALSTEEITKLLEVEI